MSQVPVFNEPPSSPGPSTQPKSPKVHSPNHGQAQPNQSSASRGRLTSLIAPARSRSGSDASQKSISRDELGGSSGRSTPELKRRAGKAASSALATDAKYKKFAQLVDKSLQSFESVNEWADFISFLSRLLKTLQTPSPPYPEIPRKLIVSKRLAQCLNPALPSGVHHRALDVYAFIFGVIGPEGLKRDLLIWSSGLFPFFQYAATSVRPSLINIYETYYLPLGADLRSATKALILALLPGMEEETGDFFDKILTLLDRISNAVTCPFFLQNIHLILISSPSSRLSALNYLSRRLPKPADDRGIDGGLTIRGISAALNDQNVLVRRTALDLLLKLLTLDGPVMSNAEPKDKQIIMRAASGVVLQRELSLSRRVYSWLLGSSESSAEQVAYFKTHGLELLASTLQVDMEVLGSSTDVADAQRPFKIFLSLLDKWEVGSPLSERLALPALKTIKNATSASTHVLPEEVIATALAVYEAIEPMVTWKLLYASVQAELFAQESQLVQWLLNSVPQHDEEVNSVHIPVMLDAVLTVIASNMLTAEALHDAFRLATALTRLIMPTTFAKSSSSLDVPADQRSVATLLYDSDGDPHLAQQRLHNEVVPRIVTSAFGICQTALRDYRQELQSLVEAVKIVTTLIDREAPGLALVNGPVWLASVVAGLSKLYSFLVIETLVMAALKASRCPIFRPAVDITSGATMSTILDALFRYLRPDAAPYHSRAVELLWDYNRLAEVHTLENVVARRMASTPFNGSAFDGFGIFWRLTDDSMLPGEIFNIPISLVLDALKSTDPDVQRQAETWMRCNLRSYFRVVDPIISRLLDPSIQYQGDTYGAPADLGLIRHHLEDISTLFRFGGQGLSKACHSTEIRASPHHTLIQRVEAVWPNATSYLEVMILLLVRFVRIEASPSKRHTTPAVIKVQSAALELLQTIISRGDVSHTQLNDLKVSLVDKLTTAVQRRHLTLQSKILHLLHSTLNALSAITSYNHNHRRSPSLNEKRSSPEPATDFDHDLVQMIIDGVSSPSNLPVLQHWIDFVLMTAPQFASKSSLSHALSECFAQRLRLLIMLIQGAYARTSISVSDEQLVVSDSEVIMIMTALGRIMMILASGPGVNPEDVGRQAEGEKGLFGLVSGVFTVEAPANESTKSDYPRYLDDAIHALLITWTITSPSVDSDGEVISRSQTYENIRSRTRKVLEKTFKMQPLGVMTSCIHVWATCSPDITDAAIFDCVDALTPSAQRVVELVCGAVSGKSARSSSEFRADPACLAFLEAYISRLEAPIAVQVWTTLFSFAREVVAAITSGSARTQLLPVLQCLTALVLIVSRTSALEDKRLRRDLQDTYPKVLDLVVTNASRIAASGIWIRTPLTGIENGKDDISSGRLTDDQGVQRIHDFLAESVIPSLRTLLVDADRVNSACSGIMVTAASPAFRKQQIDSDVLRMVIEITKIPSALKTWRIQISESFNDSRFFKARSKRDIGYWKVLVCALMDSDKERFGDHLGRITSASSANIFTNREQEMLAKSLNLRRLSFILLSAEPNHYLTQLPGIQERLVEMLRSSAVSPKVHSEVYLCLRVLLCRISAQHLTNFWPVIHTELLRIFELTMDDPPEDGSESLQLILAACKFLDLLLVIQSEDFQVHQWMFVTDTTDAIYPPEGYTPEAIMDCLTEILSESSHGGQVGSSGTAEQSDVAHADHHLPTTIHNTLKHSEKQDQSEDEEGEEKETNLRRPRLAKLKILNSINQLQPFFSRASIDTFESSYQGLGVDWDYMEDGLNAEVFDL